MAMAALQEFHAVSVSLVISPAGVPESGALEVIALATRKQDTSGVLPQSVSRKRFYPSRDSKSCAGLVYRLLLELDLDCGKMWAQAELFKRA